MIGAVTEAWRKHEGADIDVEVLHMGTVKRDDQLVCAVVGVAKEPVHTNFVMGMLRRFRSSPMTACWF